MAAEVGFGGFFAPNPAVLLPKLFDLGMKVLALSWSAEATGAAANLVAI